MLGRGSKVEGRGSGRRQIHDSIIRWWLGRSFDAKTAHKTPKKQMGDRPMDQPTDGPTDQPTDGQTLV